MNFKATLSLQWCPTMGVEGDRFFIHYLKITGSGKKIGPNHLDIKKDLSPELQEDLKDCWPNLKKHGDNDEDEDEDERFLAYEWRRHGRRSGMSPEDYFRTAIQLYKKVPNYEGLGLQLGVKMSVSEARDSIEEAFHVKVCIGVKSSCYIHELEFQSNQTLEFVDNPQKRLGRGTSMATIVELPKEPIATHNLKPTTTSSNRSRKSQSKKNPIVENPNTVDNILVELPTETEPTDNKPKIPRLRKIKKRLVSWSLKIGRLF